MITFSLSGIHISFRVHRTPLNGFFERPEGE